MYNQWHIFPLTISVPEVSMDTRNEVVAVKWTSLCCYFKGEMVYCMYLLWS